MSKKNTILRGTFILTMTGFLSRVMGFFYRIFMSRVFGEEGVGLYQLVFPVYSLCIALSIAGTETAISRTVARKRSMGHEEETREVLFCGLTYSLILSFICAAILRKYTGFFAAELLGDSRCEPLLKIIACTLPFCATHSCISGYYYGIKETKVPAASQLVEQTARILFVYIFYWLLTKNGYQVSVSLAVCGIVIGEVCSAVYTLHSLSGKKQVTIPLHQKIRAIPSQFRELLSLSLPLTANRMLINLLQSIEAVSIPAKLQLYHHSASEALSIYGVLNGMAMPCILFPSAITNSVSVMLMPTVAEMQAADDRTKLWETVKKVTSACFILGLFCCFIFLLFGPWIGMTLFGSKSAGKFIVTLAWICPFLYTDSALLSVINGLGKSGSTLIINATGLLIRITGVYLAIPLFGIQGYLWGLLLSQLVTCLIAVFVIWRAI